MNLRSGIIIGPYRLVEQVGSGGMSTVYKAYQENMKRHVALKVLVAHHAQDPLFTERFTREARIVAGLEHRHILPIYDFGQRSGVTYLAMRFLDGGTLKELMAHGQPTLGDVLRIIDEVSSALDYAHKRGVVHRDIKPGNIMVDTEGTAFLTDFGIAKVVESGTHLTQTGASLGTPAYMAPEQSLGRPIDGRTDTYGLGVVLYELMTGQQPYRGDTPMAVALAHIHEPLPLPTSIDPNISPQVEAVIVKALAKSPEDRYQSAAELAAALRQAVTEDGTSLEGTIIRELVTQAQTTRAARPQPSTTPTAFDLNDDPAFTAALDEAPATGGTSPTQPQSLWQRLNPFTKRWLLVSGLGSVALCSACSCVLMLGITSSVSQERDLLATQVAVLAAQSGLPIPEQAAAIVGGDEGAAYDDFDDEAFNNRVDLERWLRSGPETGTALCSFTQFEGELNLTADGVTSETPCLLSALQPLEVGLGNLSRFEMAGLRLTADTPLNGWGGMRLTSQLEEDTWQADCGLLVAEDAVEATFRISDTERATGEVSVILDQQLEIDREGTYTLSLSVDAASQTITCRLDDTLLGTINLEDPELETASFIRSLVLWGSGSRPFMALTIDEIWLE